MSAVHIAHIHKLHALVCVLAGGLNRAQVWQYLSAKKPGMSFNHSLLSPIKGSPKLPSGSCGALLRVSATATVTRGLLACLLWA